MVPLHVMESIALRYDTALSRAMLRALGVPVPRRPWPSPRPVPERWRYGGMMECFRNKCSPMDMR